MSQQWSAKPAKDGDVIADSPKARTCEKRSQDAILLGEAIKSSSLMLVQSACNAGNGEREWRENCGHL
jgi:hypothetical protein